MIKIINISLLLLFIISSTMAQNVGIGTATPHPSAKLDIEDTNKGLLVPRIDIPNLSAAAPVTAPETSLLVYNTNTTTGLGYYYWDGTSWIRLEDQSTNSDNDWHEVGTSTSPNDINDNIFTQGDVGIGLITPTSPLHLDAGNTLNPWVSLQGGGGIHENMGLRFWDQGTDANNINIIEFGHNTPYVSGARILTTNPVQNATSGAKMIFETASDNIATWNANQLVMNNNGNVGIGIDNPENAAHIYRNGPAHLRIEGDQLGYVNAAVILHANEGSNARGLGTFMYDQGSQSEWFAGRPYSGSDRFVIHRKVGLTGHEDETSAIVSGAGTATTTERFMTVENNGYVGINTNNPDMRLSVFERENSNYIARFHSTGITGDAYQGMRLGSSPGNSGNNIYADFAVSKTNDIFGISVGHNSGELTLHTQFDNQIDIAIDATTSNVGIGTITPNKRLHVAGGLQVGSNGVYTDLIFETGTLTGIYEQVFDVYPRTIPGSGQSEGLTHFRNSSSVGFTRHDVAVEGYIGVGTAAPISTLHAENGPTMTSGYSRTATFHAQHPVIQFKGISNTGNSGFIGYDAQASVEAMRFWTGHAGNDHGGSGTNAMSIHANGNVGIATGTAIPGTKLQVNGTASKPGGGTWTATSDKRTKKDIVQFSDGLNVLTQINPVTFKYNGLYNTEDDGNDYVGIIAQDVQKVAPYMIGSNMVSRNSETTSRDSETSNKEEILNYDGGTYLLYVLVNSVKEQQQIITKQEEENAALKASLKDLETRLEKLETK